MPQTSCHRLSLLTNFEDFWDSCFVCQYFYKMRTPAIFLVSQFWTLITDITDNLLNLNFWVVRRGVNSGSYSHYMELPEDVSHTFVGLTFDQACKKKQQCLQNHRLLLGQVHVHGLQLTLSRFQLVMISYREHSENSKSEET